MSSSSVIEIVDSDSEEEQEEVPDVSASLKYLFRIQISISFITVLNLSFFLPFRRHFWVLESIRLLALDIIMG
jgi:hypothetical protein